MEVWEAKISNIGEVRALLEERGLNQAEAMVAIAYGETEGKKLVHKTDSLRSLVRTRQGPINVYVDYSRHGEGWWLRSAYSHRTSLASDERGGTPNDSPGATSEWICHQCGVEAGAVEDIALVHKEAEVGLLAGFRCPSCGLELLSESVVVEELSAAEDMLFSK